MSRAGRGGEVAVDAVGVLNDDVKLCTGMLSNYVLFLISPPEICPFIQKRFLLLFVR